MVKQFDDLKKMIDEERPTDEIAPVLEELGKRVKPGRMGRLLQKNGEFSLTRTLLIAAWVLGLSLYVFGSLFAGAQIPVIGLTVPAFASGDFLAVTGAASSLYFATHNVRVGGGNAKPGGG